MTTVIDLTPGHTEDEIEKMLESPEGEPFYTWLGVGKALHHYYGNTQEAFSLWVTWTNDHSGYTTEQCNDVWFDITSGNTP